MEHDGSGYPTNVSLEPFRKGAPEPFEQKAAKFAKADRQKKEQPGFLAARRRTLHKPDRSNGPGPHEADQGHEGGATTNTNKPDIIATIAYKKHKREPRADLP